MKECLLQADSMLDSGDTELKQTWFLLSRAFSCMHGESYYWGWGQEVNGQPSASARTKFASVWDLGGNSKKKKIHFWGDKINKSLTFLILRVMVIIRCANKPICGLKNASGNFMCIDVTKWLMHFLSSWLQRKYLDKLLRMEGETPKAWMPSEMNCLFSSHLEEREKRGRRGWGRGGDKTWGGEP